MSSVPLFHLEESSQISLQNQIRAEIVNAIHDGFIGEGMPLPSTRKMAQQLKVSRNTVSLAYDNLIADGYLISRHRSGYFVNPDIMSGKVRLEDAPDSAPQESTRGSPDWDRICRIDPRVQANVTRSQNWRSFEFPFVYGQLDPELFPVNKWRECSRDAVSVGAIKEWTSDRFDRDDPLLLEQIRTRILNRRGIHASEDEILITVGSQQGLYLLAELLLDESTTLGIEHPGYINMANIAQLQRGQVMPLPLDRDGLVPDLRVQHCDAVYITPSHQCPTTVTMPLQRRLELLQLAGKHDFIVIEDDYESEVSFNEVPTPALKSLDRDGRVLYVGSLSKTLAPGLRFGFLVGPPALIKKARALRQLMLRHPPANNQRAVALFLARGYHDTLLRGLTQVYKRRAEVMDAALQKHLPHCRSLNSGGSSFWVEGPKGLDSRELKRRAIEQGILLESADTYLLQPGGYLNCFKLGYSSINEARIEPGIERLAALIQAISEGP